jgi:hypothetical protein
LIKNLCIKIYFYNVKKRGIDISCGKINIDNILDNHDDK